MTVPCPPLLLVGAFVVGLGFPPFRFFCFFYGGGLPVPPSAFPWLVHWSAFEVANRVAVAAAVGCGPCPGPMGQVGYVKNWPGGMSCRVRFWLCWLGGCASWSRETLGKAGVGLPVSPGLCRSGCNFLKAVCAGRPPPSGGGGLLTGVRWPLARACRADVALSDGCGRAFFLSWV